MPDLVKFFINGKAVTASEDESIWEVSKRQGNPRITSENSQALVSVGHTFIWFSYF